MRQHGSQRDASRAADRRKDETLGQYLTTHPRRASTERGAHREFARSRLRTAENEVGDVDARDEQHGGHRGGEQLEHRLHRPHDRLAHRLDARRDALVRLGILRLDQLRGRRDVARGLRERRARLELRRGARPHRAAIRHDRVGKDDERREQIDRRAWIDVCVARQHADHLHPVVVEGDHAADQRPVAAELAHPEIVCEHGDLGRVELRITRRQKPAERDAQAEHTWVGVVHLQRSEELRVSSMLQREVVALEDSDVREVRERSSESP